MNSEDQIILVALRNAYLAATKRIEETPVDYQLRRIFRDYSERFHTPLYIVRTLPLDEVLQDYWEACYEDMKAEDMLADIRRLSQDPERARAAREQEDADEVDLYRMAQDEKKASSQAALKKLDEVVNRFRNAVVKKEGGIKAGMGGREADLVQPVKAPPKKLEEGISMRFVSEDEVDDDMDALGIMDDPKGK